MTTEVCCATRVWQPRHSRHCSLPRLPNALGHGSFLYGTSLQFRDNRQAFGSSRLCYCNQARIPSSAGPDISLLRPELQRQWHHAKNQHLGDRQITASSGLRVWWSCKQCPCGLLHEWLTAVGNRQDKDTQCPFCTNRSLCPHNSLSTVAPAVAAYWDTAKNGVTPDQIMAHSGARRHWLCPKCGHSWQANIVAKVKGRSKCPKCSNANRPYKKQPSLTQSQHPAMLEFDFERNRRAGLDPDKIMAGSAKMVHWIRTKCPRGRAHLFVASPHNRIGLNYGCPYCAGKKACICNSLQSLYPVLAAEYDTARNGDGPQQVLAGSAKMAFWKDATGHTWKQAVRQRTEPSQQRAKRAAIKSCNKLRDWQGSS
ncbi:TPA: hypothetical protein ACH3X2_001911 [Trebouxia sp. C0005]